MRRFLGFNFGFISADVALWGERVAKTAAIVPRVRAEAYDDAAEESEVKDAWWESNKEI